MRVNNVLRDGEIMLLASPAKVGATSALIDLALSVVAGRKWLNRFECETGRVLYINLESGTGFFWKRLEMVAQARGIELSQVKNRLIIWTINGSKLNKLLDPLIAAIKVYSIDAVIIDPAYKVIEGDENIKADVSRFFSNLESICKEQCAVVIRHYLDEIPSRPPLDCVCGSSLFCALSDNVITLTQTQHGSKKFNFECHSRNFPLQKLELHFDFPVFG